MHTLPTVSQTGVAGLVQSKLVKHPKQAPSPPLAVVSQAGTGEEQPAVAVQTRQTPKSQTGAPVPVQSKVVRH
jgi:hypothetical protein